MAPMNKIRLSTCRICRMFIGRRRNSEETYVILLTLTYIRMKENNLQKIVYLFKETWKWYMKSLDLLYKLEIYLKITTEIFGSKPVIDIKFKK